MWPAGTGQAWEAHAELDSALRCASLLKCIRIPVEECSKRKARVPPYTPPQRRCWSAPQSLPQCTPQPAAQGVLGEWVQFERGQHTGSTGNGQTPTSPTMKSASVHSRASRQDCKVFFFSGGQRAFCHQLFCLSPGQTPTLYLNHPSMPCLPRLKCTLHTSPNQGLLPCCD